MLRVILLLVFCTLPSYAQEPLSIINLEAESGSAEKAEISVTTITASQSDFAANWMKQLISETLALHPDSRPIIMLGLNDSPSLQRWSEDLSLRVSLSSKAVKIVRQKLPSEWDRVLTEIFPGWVKENNVRLTLTAKRFVLNGSATYLSFVITPEISWPGAILLGSVIGSMSGSLQFFNRDYVIPYTFNTRLFTKWAGYDQQRLKEIRFKMKNRESISADDAKFEKSAGYIEKAEMFTRWGTIEATFLAGTYITLAILDYPLPGTAALATESLQLIALAIASQGQWDTAIGTERNNKLSAKPGLEEVKEVENTADRKTLVSSLVAVGLSMIKLAGYDKASYVGFAVFGATGLYKRLQYEREGGLVSCQALFQ